MVDYGHYIETDVPTGADVITVPEGGRLQDVVILRPGAQEFKYKKIVALADSETELCIVVFPGVDTDIPLYLDLAGEGARAKISGVYLCGGSEKISFHTEVLHRVGACVSEQLFNGIAGGNSQAGFYGKITVAPDAQKTEAYQSNHNIILSGNAKLDTKPQLEIYADDVKCSHGATIGSLNPEELFYMRSRGIPESEAKVLQLISFVYPVLEHIPDTERRSEIAEEIENSIRDIVKC